MTSNNKRKRVIGLPSRPSMEEEKDVGTFMTSKVVKKDRRRKVYNPPVYPYINEVPLKEKDEKSWFEFLKLGEKEPEVGTISVSLSPESTTKVKNSIEHDHPFVHVTGNFAVTAFNKLCKEHVKKGKSNNLCHHEVMNCKWIKSSGLYCFYMTIEAIEEGILGVYEAVVACNASNGRRNLIRFTILDREPIGKIAMMLPHLIRLKFQYKTMKGIKKDIEIKLETTHKSLKGVGKKNKGKVAREFIRLKKQHKAMKGVCNMLYQQLQLQIPITWNQRSDPDGWFVPSHATGLHNRSDNAPCKGYDYCTRLLAIARNMLDCTCETNVIMDLDILFRTFNLLMLGTL